MELDLGQGRSLFTDMNVKKKKKYLQKHTAAQRGILSGAQRRKHTLILILFPQHQTHKHTLTNTHIQGKIFSCESDIVTEKRLLGAFIIHHNPPANTLFRHMQTHRTELTFKIHPLWYFDIPSQLRCFYLPEQINFLTDISRIPSSSLRR